MLQEASPADVGSPTGAIGPGVPQRPVTPDLPASHEAEQVEAEPLEIAGDPSDQFLQPAEDGKERAGAVEPEGAAVEPPGTEEQPTVDVAPQRGDDADLYFAEIRRVARDDPREAARMMRDVAEGMDPGEAVATGAEETPRAAATLKAQLEQRGFTPEQWEEADPATRAMMEVLFDDSRKTKNVLADFVRLQDGYNRKMASRHTEAATVSQLRALHDRYGGFDDAAVMKVAQTNGLLDAPAGLDAAYKIANFDNQAARAQKKAVQTVARKQAATMTAGATAPGEKRGVGKGMRGAAEAALRDLGARFRDEG